MLDVVIHGLLFIYLLTIIVDFHISAPLPRNSFFVIKIDAFAARISPIILEFLQFDCLHYGIRCPRTRTSFETNLIFNLHACVKHQLNFFLNVPNHLIFWLCANKRGCSGSRMCGVWHQSTSNAHSIQQTYRQKRVQKMCGHNFQSICK